MKLLIATQNRAKQAEHKKILSKLAKEYKVDLEIVFPQDVGLTDEPEETGNTIEENAYLKLKYYYDKSKIPTISDDGSFEIDALGGLPGAQAKYWADEAGTDEKIIEKTILMMKNFKKKEERSARLGLCLSYFDGKTMFQEITAIEGYIAEEPAKKWIRGFPYRGLLIVSGVERYYDELTPEEHKKFNHREKALRGLLKKIFINQ